MIALNIDSEGYKQKPKKFVGLISDRLRCCNSIAAIDPAELASFIEEGRTFTPAQIGGDIDEWKPYTMTEKGRKRVALQNPETGREYCTSDFWINQQIIVADIDNKKNGSSLPSPMTPAQASEVCRAHGITPYLMYWTFSNSQECPRFRIVLVLDAPITDFGTAKRYTENFAGIFNAEVEGCADTSIEPAKIIFGGPAGCVFENSGSITNIAALEALPPAENAAEGAEMPQNDAGGQIVGNMAQKPANANRGIVGSYSALVREFETAVQSFDLAAYVMREYGAKYVGDNYNPCPICKHDDCLVIDGALYKCYSDKHPENHPENAPNHSTRCGNIIDFIMQIDNCDVGTAKDKFKVEFMGQDLETWRAAWIAEQNAKSGISDAAIEQAHRDFEQGEQHNTNTQEEQHNTEAEPAADPAGAPARAPVIPGMSAKDYLQGGKYDADIQYMQKFAGRKMGMHSDIDRYLTLYPGLAVLGGQASLGKTTFSVNMARVLMRRGEHVLYFAFEQTTAEIMNKFIAGKVFENNPQTTTTNTEVKNGERIFEIQSARAEGVIEWGDKLRLIEFDFENTAADIIEAVKAYMKENPGIKPVVIVDYLQLIAPPADFRGTTRDYMDSNLKALKGFQKSTGLFVLVISSFNRSSYIEAVTYESFKETGMIESTCDYVWGLELTIQNINNEDYYTKEGKRGGISVTTDREKHAMLQEAQKQMPKKVTFVSLKSRGGRQIYSADFDYYPQHDFYMQAGGVMQYKDNPATDKATTEAAGPYDASLLEQIASLDD